MLETILEITLCISLYEMSKWIVSVAYEFIKEDNVSE